MTKKIKIIVADNQEIFRKSLTTFLKTNAEFEIIGDAADGRELLQQLKQLHADIVLMDTEIPVMDCKTTLGIINTRFPDVRVIILSNQSDLYHKSDFMANGANCYLSKNADVNTLILAIKKVKSDGYFFDNSTSMALLDSVLKDKKKTALPHEAKFNERETEILKKICGGKTNKEIALSMSLSTSTIDFYRAKIYGKTNCNTTTGLLKYALKTGMIALSQI